MLIALAAVACGGPGPADPDEIIKLLPPSNVTLRAATDESLTFQWDVVEGATGYDWRLTKNGTEVKQGSEGKRNAFVSGLEPGTEYKFSVRAVSEEEQSPYSKEIVCKTTGTAPVPPDPSADTQCVDAPLVVAFASTPTLGTSGLIRVLDASGKEVDRIDLADMSTVTVRSDGAMVPKVQITSATVYNTFMDAIPCGGRWRIVHYTPLRIDNNRLLIYLHSGALDFGKTYTLTMDAGVVAGDGGIAAGDYTFTTSGAPSTSSITVAADGSGDFCTISRALSYAADGARIKVEKGVYREMLYLRDKKDIALAGRSSSMVRIEYPNNESYCGGSGQGSQTRPVVGSAVGTAGGRGVFLIENCDNLQLLALTIENTFGEQKGQAETIYFNSGSNKHRLIIDGCRLISWQDTFLTKGRVWVNHSEIAGHCDYIWGYPDVCLFEDCEIRSRAAGYIVQARVPSGSKGFVFLNCTLTSESGVASGSVYLARSSGDAGVQDNVTYVNCTMCPAIAPAGWYPSPAPTPSAATATAGWKEFGSVDASGAPVTASRNSYGRILTAAEADPYLSREKVMGE